MGKAASPSPVTIDELNRRLNELSAEFEKSRRMVAISPTWWHDHAGRFEGDATFAEIARLGRQQRNASRKATTTTKKRARS